MNLDTDLTKEKSVETLDGNLLLIFPDFSFRESVSIPSILSEELKSGRVHILFQLRILIDEEGRKEQTETHEVRRILGEFRVDERHLDT